MSNDSSRSENATATTTNASGVPDTMSEGARILIEAMKTNPEEFMPEGKYNWVLNALTAPRSSYALPMLSTRDHDLILTAVERYIIEPQFTERVVKTTLGVDEQEETMRFKAEGRYAFGHTDPRALIMNTAQATKAQITHSLYTSDTSIK